MDRLAVDANLRPFAESLFRGRLQRQTNKLHHAKGIQWQSINLSTSPHENFMLDHLIQRQPILVERAPALNVYIDTLGSENQIRDFKASADRINRRRQGNDTGRLGIQLKRELGQICYTVFVYVLSVKSLIEMKPSFLRPTSIFRETNLDSDR